MRVKITNITGQQRGVILPTLMISTIVVLAIVLVISQSIVDNYKTVLGEQHRVNSQFAVDAGVDYAISQINGNSGWAGEAEAELYSNDEFRTTHESVVTDLASGNKEVVVTARTYSPPVAAEPESTRSVTVELYSVTSGGISGASVVTGVGGLQLTNNAKIVAGSVYVNGTISMTNNSQIGTSTNPVSVRVAHQSCPEPPNGTYPSVCADGENGEPIFMTNSSHIYGEVQATNQTTGDRMSGPGLVAGSPAPEAIPDHNRAAQIAAESNSMSGSDASCWGSNTVNIPANTLITGDVNWSNRCDITVNGDFRITGNLTMSNQSEMIVAESLGATMPNIMIDGTNGFNMSNNTDITSNSFGTGVQIITYHSAASCSPNCADVTGTDLYNSRNIATINLNNNASAPDTIFFARWSQVNIVNAGDIGALVGQTVRLNNSATVTFGASVGEGTGGTETWLIYSYRQS